MKGFYMALSDIEIFALKIFVSGNSHGDCHGRRMPINFTRAFVSESQSIGSTELSGVQEYC
jgi:hypothetical protein